MHSARRSSGDGDDADGPVDAAAEVRWVAEQRERVAQYLRREGLRHGCIGDKPAWHVHPYLAIFAVESLKSPGRMGWWAICGDVPTDYVSFGDADHPRAVLRHFAKQWEEVAALMLAGKPHPEITLGSPEEWPVLGDLLRRRAKTIRDFATDDSLWDDDEG